MKPRPYSIAICLGSAALLAGGAVFAQAPAPAPTPTLWSFLGIPQTTKFLGDNLLNRKGNFPGMEKKPPLKKIADPENLKSENPAIKKAAEIKKEEDLAKQKIKAVKYLASIGCGCHNRDGGITDALMAAMGDCTEEVRFETINAISSAASEEECENCKLKSCCSEEISKKLFEIAYGRDDEGCFLEPSERVREAAQEAMTICCPGAEDYFSESAETNGGLQFEGSKGSGTFTPGGEQSPKPAKPEASPSDENKPGGSASSRRKFPGGSPGKPSASTAKPDGTVRSAQVPGEPLAPIVTPQELTLRQPVRFAGLSGQTSQESESFIEQTIPAVETPEPQVRQRLAPIVARKGIVYQVDSQHGTVEVRFIDGGQVTADNRLIAFHTYLVSGRMAVAQLEVVESRDGEATLRAIGGLRTMKIAVGDEVEVRR